jgi:hypothetical protein
MLRILIWFRNQVKPQPGVYVIPNITAEQAYDAIRAAQAVQYRDDKSAQIEMETERMRYTFNLRDIEKLDVEFGGR